MIGIVEVESQIPCGAFPSSGETCTWRVWAPAVSEVQLVLPDSQGNRTLHPMAPQGDGCFACEASGITEGQRYWFQLNGDILRPDPASRWQPDGVHGASAVWNPQKFKWTDQQWAGTPREELVIYELHVGTFAAEGTFAAITSRLDQIRDLGVTAIQLMPVAQFPGRKGWGYDGTYWYAVQNSYGGPRELQRFVDACHHAGLSVFLDVVYNHFGPEGNYTGDFGPYVTAAHRTPWGSAINYDGPGCEPVRAFVLNNVRQWIRDFHLDGLRLDATHAIHDSTTPHIIAEIKAVADSEARELGKIVHVLAESDRNDVQHLRAVDDAGHGLDAQWNDDFHHCVHALLTGERDGYYQDFQEPLPQLNKVINNVFAFDGNFSTYRGRNHGSPTDGLSGDRFVVSVQNHDQTGNRALGERFGQLVSLNSQRFAAAIMLLSPYLPMLFMGEEYGEVSPFPFFCEFSDEQLRNDVRAGRREEFKSFGWDHDIPDPFADATFESAILSWNWWNSIQADGLRQLYRDLLKARRQWQALRNFQHREAHLIRASQGETVLKVVRGDPAFPDQQVEAYFNPGMYTVILPAMSRLKKEILLSTEEVRYGGWKRSGRLCWDLSPYECIIVGR